MQIILDDDDIQLFNSSMARLERNGKGKNWFATGEFAREVRRATRDELLAKGVKLKTRGCARTLSRAQAIEAFKLRRDGFTWKELSEHFDCSESAVRTAYLAHVESILL